MTVAAGKYFSEILNRKKSFVSVFPDNFKDEELIKCITLLHGIQGDETDWITNVCLERLANKYNVCFLCPSGENSFYTDHENGDLFGRAFGEEFYEKMHELFPISKKREDNGIIGFSMGGYGALRLGIKYSNLYSYIGAFSPALIFYKRYRNDPLFNKVFSMGLEDSENDIKILYNHFPKKNKMDIYLTCGNEDPLDKYTQELYKFLKDKNANVEYDQNLGFHDFTLWRKDLVNILEKRFEKEEEIK